MVAVLGNERRVTSAETNRGTTVILAVGDTEPTGVESTVQERGTLREIGRKCEENRTGGGGVL